MSGIGLEKNKIWISKESREGKKANTNDVIILRKQNL